jgi:hypothetical protein
MNEWGARQHLARRTMPFHRPFRVAPWRVEDSRLPALPQLEAHEGEPRESGFLGKMWRSSKDGA